MAGMIVSKLAGAFAGNIGQTVKDIAGVFKVPPEQVEEHRFELEKIQSELVSKQLDAASVEVQAAAANIQAEEKSGDKYTERSRPTFIYLVELILFFNCVVVPVYQALARQPLAVLSLPHELYWLFGSCVLGYTGAGHWSDFMALPGKSEIALPGLTMRNDSSLQEKR